MTKSVLCILIAILVYMAMMVVIGVIYSKKNSSVGDFYLGGRRLGPIVSAMSAEASDMSSYLLMGLPGLAYLSGGRLDGDRSRHRYLSELAAGGKAAPGVFPEMRKRHHHPGLFLQPLS